MAILKVARMGHPVLRARARPIDPAQIGSPRIQQLIDDMFETMQEYQGVGLAAPQVHASLRVFVPGPRRTMRTARSARRAAPAPSIPRSPPLVGARRGLKGASAFDIRAPRPRSRRFGQGLATGGKRIEVKAGGFTARDPHETDHLDGVLFFDRMKSFQTLTFLDEFGRYWSGPDSKPVEVE